MDFNIVGYYLYGAPANGNSLQGQLFLRPLREAVAALPGFQFGDIAEENLSRSLDEVQLTLDEQGHGQVTIESQWKEVHSPLQLILQASLLESGGRPRRAARSRLSGRRRNCRVSVRSSPVRRSTTTVPIPPPTNRSSTSTATPALTSSMPMPAARKAVSGLQVRLIRERRDYFWNWSESEGWQSQFDQKS